MGIEESTAVGSEPLRGPRSVIITRILLPCNLGDSAGRGGAEALLEVSKAKFRSYVGQQKHLS